MAVLIASHTRSVFSASRMVLPIRISRGHGRGVGHAGAAEGLHQRFLDDAVLDVQGQLAGALLRRAPADAVGKAADVLDFLRLHPLALFGDRAQDRGMRPWQRGTYAGLPLSRSLCIHPFLKEPQPENRHRPVVNFETFPYPASYYIKFRRKSKEFIQNANKTCAAGHAENCMVCRGKTM